MGRGRVPSEAKLFKDQGAIIRVSSHDLWTRVITRERSEAMREPHPACAMLGLEADEHDSFQVRQ